MPHKEWLEMIGVVRGHTGRGELILWCGYVGMGAFSAGKSTARDTDTRDTDNKRHRGLNMPHNECLEMIGRCVRTHN